MLLAIDLGNTKAALGVWSGNQWKEIRRWPSQSLDSNLELLAWLRLLSMDNSEVQIACASVNPSAEPGLISAVSDLLNAEIRFLRTASDFKLKTRYSSELGADRMANMIGALDQFEPPMIVIDVGTATTIDAVDNEGVHIGGVILAGPQFSIDALLAQSPLMKKAEVRKVGQIFGLNTVDALSIGHFIGHMHALEGILATMKANMIGSATVVTTGGLGRQFCEASVELGEYRPLLTLDGIRIAGEIFGIA